MQWHFLQKEKFLSFSKTGFRGIKSKLQPYSKRKLKTYYLPLGGEMNTSSTVLPTQKSWSFVNKETWPNGKSPPHTKSCPWGKVRKDQSVSYRSESHYSVTPTRYFHAAASSINPGPPPWTSRTHKVMAWSHFHLPWKYLELQIQYTVTCVHLQERRSGFPNSHLPHSFRKPLWWTQRENARIPAKEETQEQLTGDVVNDHYSWLSKELFSCRLWKLLG